MVDVNIKFVPMIGLIALIPVLLYTINTSQPFVYGSAACVLIIAASFYYMLTGQVGGQGTGVSNAE
ncbi:MAG: hypothetical protein SV377_00645 [Halobacteria archaeon]|nr:hypothetical protein [Halobacteria archaeon]